ncbi:rhodanese-like domain-containing protein [Mesobacillus subterraneus]|uniref:Rhodanese domain-containing protein n=1 Tax=Mesobacillus subterraneus TaxID=285983 RepID=A0A0D6ZB18_9BACI|nr:rhodanese-like domain-containing protein [Mesobacillus subterraneus]KIY21753.1 hypothetical protein UB32_11935 [Mesobacillus subterraneus]
MNLFNLFRHPKPLENLSPQDISEKWNESPKPVILDVRTQMEYQSGHIEGAKSFPWGQEKEVASQYSADTPLILICKTGHRSQAAANTLLKLGFKKLSHLEGGMDRWKKEGFPTE